MTSLPIVVTPGTHFIVKVNDVVKAGQIIARKTFQKEYTINLVEEFSISLAKARKLLLIKPGDEVRAGEVVAVKKSFLGMSEERIVSKVTGTFSRYERDTGNLVITIDTKENIEDIISPVDGTVVMCDNDKIVIGTERDVFIGNKGTGGSATGEVYVLEGAFPKTDKDARENEISLYYDLDSQAVGKIVIGGEFARDIIIKSIGMGVVGIIGTNIHDEDIDYLATRKLKVPIIELDNKNIKEIIKWKGKKIYLNSQEKVIIILHA